MTTITRPENRQRSDGSRWAEVLPACYRSEAFAEDLDGPAEATAGPCAPQAAGQPLRWLALSAVLTLGVLPGIATR